MTPKKLMHNYHAETDEQYAWIELELEVKDANGDKYAKDFTILNTAERLAIVCPYCGEYLQTNNRGEYCCANGHMAYTITAPDVDSDINDSFRAGMESAETE